MLMATSMLATDAGLQLLETKCVGDSFEILVTVLTFPLSLNISEKIHSKFRHQHPLVTIIYLAESNDKTVLLYQRKAVHLCKKDHILWHDSCRMSHAP